MFVFETKSWYAIVALVAANASPLGDSPSDTYDQRTNPSWNDIREGEEKEIFRLTRKADYPFAWHRYRAQIAIADGGGLKSQEDDESKDVAYALPH